MTEAIIDNIFTKTIFHHIARTLNAISLGFKVKFFKIIVNKNYFHMCRNKLFVNENNCASYTDAQNTIERKVPSILVLMSTYNGAQYLKKQIESIIKQDVNASVSVRIRDDGSTDNTCEVIEGLQNNYPGKIELIKGNRIGYNASFLNLICNSFGYDFYAISDQDDIWLKDKLKIGLNRLSRHETSKPLLFSSVSYIVNNDMVPNGITRRQKRKFTIYNTAIQNICPGHNQIFNESLAKLIRDSNTEPLRLFVYDLWIMSYASIYGEIIFLNKPLTYYRQHSNNELGSTTGRFKKLLLSINRFKNGESKKLLTQVKYLMELNEKQLKKIGCYDELYNFVRNKNFHERLFYAFNTKLYRQSLIETIAFRVMIIFDKFN